MKHDDDNISAQRLCTQIFEKIAKEGRKFGVGFGTGIAKAFRAYLKLFCRNVIPFYSTA
ncbi:MAG: hypothetical protein KatS3mg028_0263 [Bacteroidia bacterium]|nr:MAG: hypothetical protein KatS3mg028_0263 [Bacteroidia bacterium]